MNKNKIILFIISIISFIFFLLIAFDVSPYLRGPGEYPPNWRWQYQFTNTLSKIWFPSIVIAAILGFAWFLEKKKEKDLANKIWLIFIVVIILSYLFQLSVLYFSRAGINVLIHRTINPQLNGYFTAATQITDVADFIRDYNKNVLSFPMHATGHPPGSILFFWGVNKISSFLSFINPSVAELSPAHTDVKIIWNSLKIHEKTGAVISAFLIPFLSALNILPLYFLAELLYGVRAAIRTIIIYIIIPSSVFFIPLPDVFFPLFALTALILFFHGLKKENPQPLFLAGFIFSVGFFFSLSILPILFILTYFLFKRSRAALYFGSGLTIFYISLYLIFKFNFFEMVKVLLSSLPKGRSYLIWIFYNLYDFFIFTGIPTSLLYLYMIFKKVKEPLFVAFTLMLILLNLSGAVRGEVGRIWLAFMPIFVLIVINFVTKQLKFSKAMFLSLILLQAIQILIMQEFWVMLW